MKVVVVFVFLLVSCQAGVWPRQLSGVCMEMCSSDADCPSGQHCLSNGCGHICQTRTLTLPIQVSSNDTRLQCAQCDNILQPSDCDYVTRCSQDEQCLVRKHFLFGLTTYIVGCEKTTVCQGKTLAADNFQCCSDNLCNTNTALLSPVVSTPPPPTTTTPPTPTTNTVSPFHFGRWCFKCDGNAHPAVCQEVVVCGVHETCYADKHLNNNGVLQFTSGCKRIADCVTTVRKRSVPATQCSECCTGTACNAKVCGAQDFSVSGARLWCVQCDNQQQPSECDQVTLCSQDEQCSVTKQSVFGLDTYNMGCEKTTVCQGKTLARDNFQCCGDNLCNTNTALLSPDLFTPPPPTNTQPLSGRKKCFACDHQAHPAMCLKLTTCGDHEACYAVIGITHTGGRDYSSGCLATQECPKMVRAANHNNYARELCVECCNSDYCNAKLCGAADVLATSLVCYKCEHDNVHNTQECLDVDVCQPDQRCSAEPSVHGTGQTTLGCKRTSDCGVGGVACCNTNFCNLNLTAGSAVTSPATTV